MQTAFIHDAELTSVHPAYLFTGKERDQESGLDYFGARYYSSVIGRFSSPDNGVDQDVEDPQSWNLYGYARNSPVTLMDPDGRAVNICDTNGQNCHTIDNDQTYSNSQQQDKQQGSLNAPTLGQLQNSGQSMNITDSGGNVVGTAKYIPNNPGIDGPANAAVFGQIGNQGMGAIKAFAAGSVVLGTAGGLGLAALPEAGLTTLGDLGGLSDVSQVIARAGSTVGNQSMNVANQGIAEQAAKEWVGNGARTIYGRSGQVAGEISADGTKVARITSAATKNYINLEDKLTGSNLHVRW